MRAWTRFFLVALVVSAGGTARAASSMVTSAALHPATAPPVDPSGQADRDERGLLEGVLDVVLRARWLDPEGPVWEPRRGARTEVCVLAGGEGAVGAISSDALPTVGGTVLTGLVRYYPVDRLAVVVGLRSFAGLDGAPAPGTTASSVSSLVTGARYDLVRENRFSLMWDLFSGPSVFAFADVEGLGRAPSRFAIGGEMGTGLSARYSIGPWTAEVRGTLGGRAGASPAGRAAQDGPFSSLYAAVDAGVTWSLP